MGPHGSPAPPHGYPFTGPSVGQAPDEVVEGRTREYIFILLGTCRVVEACGVRSNLGELSTGDVVARAEVGVIIAVAGFAWSTAWVAIDDATASQTLDIGVEGTAERHVLEGERAGCRVSVAVGGVTVGPPGVWVGTGLLVLVKTGVAVCVTEVLVDMGVFDGAFVLIGVAV